MSCIKRAAAQGLGRSAPMVWLTRLLCKAFAQRCRQGVARGKRPVARVGYGLVIRARQIPSQCRCMHVSSRGARQAKSRKHAETVGCPADVSAASDSRLRRDEASEVILVAVECVAVQTVLASGCSGHAKHRRCGASSSSVGVGEAG